jgi:hypothetical protein
MAKTAIALYPTGADAGHVADELKKAGYDDSQIRLLSGQGGAQADLLNKLALAPRTAAAYREGIRRGGTLLLTTAEQQQINAAVTIMSGHNSINVQEQSRLWESEGWHPDQADDARTDDQSNDGSLFGEPEMIGEHAEPQPGTKMPDQ